jgi:hypothetical protein
MYFSFTIDFFHCLEANPDDEDLNKTIEEELVIDEVGVETIATDMKEVPKSSTVTFSEGMIKQNIMKSISISTSRKIVD